MARPTDYDPAYCEQVLGWGAQGKSITWMAAQLDVSRECIYEWMRVHPEFSDAISRAKAKAQAWWEDKGETGMVAPGFNAGIWTKSMAARFPEDWREKSETALTGAGGGAIQQALTVEFVKADESSVPGVG